MKIGFLKLDYNATLPTKAHNNDLGFDLYAIGRVTIEPSAVTMVRTGIAAQFPENVGGIIKDRSSIATKRGVFVVAGVIDPQYTGEVIVAFSNPFGHHVTFDVGDKIAQMILIPSIICESEEIDEIHSTKRAAFGFGSTGN